MTKQTVNPVKINLNVICTTSLFPNLFAKIKEEREQRLSDFIASLDAESDTWEILKQWQYNELLPPSKKRMVWTLADLKKYLIERKTKQAEKELQKQADRLLTVEKAGDFLGATISVEWKKSRMWGSNPTAEARINRGNQYEYFNSGSIGVCGYDKNSTAIANAMNQSNEFLKAMYLVKEQAANLKNENVFGYGAGYGVLPSLEGGVGVSCYPAIFAKIGFTFNNTASGKTFDVYTVSKA